MEKKTQRELDRTRKGINWTAGLISAPLCREKHCQSPSKRPWDGSRALFWDNCQRTPELQTQLHSYIVSCVAFCKEWLLTGCVKISDDQQFMQSSDQFVTQNIHLSHSNAWFEFQKVILIMSTDQYWVTGMLLTDWGLTLANSPTVVCNKVAGGCISSYWEYFSDIAIYTPCHGWGSSRVVYWEKYPKCRHWLGCEWVFNYRSDKNRKSRAGS